MIKKIIIVACLFLSFVSFSQQGTASPYSFYGIGEVKFSGTLENRSMAGLSIAQDSTHLNMQNPASYANLKWTVFTIGGSNSRSTQKSKTESANVQKTTLDYIALGIPMGKFGAAIGLMPLSSVGYTISNIAADNTQSNKRFNGAGGLNKVFLGTGYKINKNLSVGANANYIFGNIQTNSLEYYTNVIVASNESNASSLSGLNFNIGTMYNTKINKDLSFFGSLYYTPESSLLSDNTRSISTVNYNLNFDTSIVDKMPDLQSRVDLKLPQKWSFGAGVGDSKKWLIGAEVSLQDAGKFANDYNSVSNVEYSKNQKFSLGGFYRPNNSPYVGYAKRITYRGGLKYEKTGLIINSTSVNDVGMTLGMTLPIPGSLSNFNLGIELGKKGTTASNLVQENYFNFNISFSLNDKWFVKSKYN